MIHSFKEHHPTLHSSSWVAKNAQVIGAVEIHEESSVWFHSVIRSEQETITIHARTNIQDNCVLHTDQHFQLSVGKRVTIGHQCIIHGCVIGDDTLIGMGSIIMNGAIIGSRCIIGAGTLVTEHMQIPDDSIAVGSPARIIKQTTSKQVQDTTENATHYYMLAIAYKQEEKTWKNMY